MLKRSVIAILSCAALMSSAALAFDTTTTLTPSADISNSCTVTGNTIPFGAYDPLSGAAVTQSATISITCTNGMDAPPVTLDQGSHPALSSSDASPLRQLFASLNHTLTYNLYSIEDFSAVWNNTTGVAAPTPDGTAHTMTVYGRIDSGQTLASAGTYTDTVTVTLTF